MTKLNKESIEKRKQTILVKYGVDEDGKSKLHVRIGSKGGSSLHTKPTGFALMKEQDLKKLRAVSSKGGKYGRLKRPRPQV